MHRGLEKVADASIPFLAPTPGRLLSIDRSAVLAEAWKTSLRRPREIPASHFRRCFAARVQDYLEVSRVWGVLLIASVAFLKSLVFCLEHVDLQLQESKFPLFSLALFARLRRSQISLMSLVQVRLRKCRTLDSAAGATG